MARQSEIEAADLAERMVALVRGFGLHRPEETPCGEAIPVAGAHALMDLSRRGPMSHGQLAVCLRLEKSTVTRLVRQLEKRQWIQRFGSDRDGRVMLIRLSQKGRHAALRLEKARRAKFEKLLAGIPRDKRSDVIKALTVLLKAMAD
jgi:DNA-binding MarR family transcriptional regulator